MELYLIRHADAGPRPDPRYPDDRDRPLSPSGKSDMKRVASGMKRCGIELDAIFHSGLIRARQTAEIVAKRYRLSTSRLRVLTALEPERPPARAIAALKKLRSFDRIAFVGHEPHLSTLAAALIAKNADGRIDLKKGGVCRVDVKRSAKGGGTLVALMTPKILKALS